jgi:hypothetical protein
MVTMNQQTKRRLLELMGILCDGSITETQFAELDRILCDEEEGPKVYREYLAIHDRLASGELLFEERETEIEAASIRGNHVIPFFGKRFGGWRGWSVAAAMVLAGFLASEFFNDDSGVYPESARSEFNSERVEFDEVPAAGLALVTRIIDARWEPGQRSLDTGEFLESDWVKLKGGVVQLEFLSGARLSLEGPASLLIVSGEECFVEHGKLVVLAPADEGSFKVDTRSSEVVDLGTEFAAVVGKSGSLDVHVLDGEVEIGVKGESNQVLRRKRLTENQAGRLEPGNPEIDRLDFDGAAFEDLRARTLWRGQLLRIQFDCGSHAGVYHGTNAPAHAIGDMGEHESYWNPIVGDQSGGFVTSDGTIAPFEIQVDYGSRPRHEFSWDHEPDVTRNSVYDTRGVFDTPLGRDHVAGANSVGLRFRGLPKGRYRVFLLGRNVLDHRKLGNFLVTKTYQSVIGVNADVKTGDVLYHELLTDPNAESWVVGQTHVVKEVEIAGPDEYLTILTAKDRRRSPKPAGGGSTISGIQIIEVRD